MSKASLTNSYSALASFTDAVYHVMMLLQDGDSSSAVKDVGKPVISLAYIGKILIAFILIFVLGAIFTLALEYLPMLILSINSLM